MSLLMSVAMTIPQVRDRSVRPADHDALRKQARAALEAAREAAT